MLEKKKLKKEWTVRKLHGASSSYARKYALNGLFLIDDVKDSDTTNIGEEKIEIKNKEQAENYKLNFGKHTGKTLKQIITEDTDYANWLYKNGDDTVKACLELLKTKE